MPNIAVGQLIDPSMVLALLVKEENVYASDSISVLFLARIRFLNLNQIKSIIQRRYGDKVLREVRKFEKLGYKLRRVHLDLDFLRKCKGSDAIPDFVKFRLVNKKLRDSLTYTNCQRNFLITEINLKKSRLRILKMNFIFSIAS